ncbi:MAG TPA: hypothetical protein VIY48_06380 [Candidatus Paceibacterota bacterium]
MIGKELSQSIDRMAELAQVETMKDGLRARCWLQGIVTFHIRSMAQLRRDRVAERLSKQQGANK